LRPYLKWLLGAAFLLGLAVSPPAGATLPGQNGPLLISSQVAAPSGSPIENLGQIFLLNEDGTASRIGKQGVGHNYDPAISPDGRFLAYVRNPIDRIRPADGDQLWLGEIKHLESARQITSGDNYDGDYRSNPVFTPDGRALMFDTSWSYKDWFDAELRSYSLKDHLQTRWLQDGPVEMAPDISPDGKTVAYETVPGSIYSGDPTEIMLKRGMNGKAHPFHAGMSTRAPGFSPDGRRLAFTARVDGTDQVFVARTDGTHLRQLTRGSGSYLPVFSPDGKSVAYETGPGEDVKIVLRNLRTNEETTIDPPGIYTELAQWTRTRLFQVVRFKSSRKQLIVRVFNPGIVVIRSGRKVIGRRALATRGTHKIGVRWKPGTRKRRVRVEFRPRGALAESVGYTLKR
jgi:Tol biopolymer transport system component